MKKSPHEKALKKIEKAEKILKKAKKNKLGFQKIKYVQKASKMAYKASLIMIKAYLKQKEGELYVKPKSFEEYSQRIKEYDENLLSLFFLVYYPLYIVGYYHGTPSVDTINRGFDNTHKLIEYVMNKKKKLNIKMFKNTFEIRYNLCVYP